jgi:hypothetical protein
MPLKLLLNADLFIINRCLNSFSKGFKQHFLSRKNPIVTFLFFGSRSLNLETACSTCSTSIGFKGDQYCLI